MLLKHYSNIDFILNLYWVDGIELTNKARKNEEEKKSWDMWLTLYLKMDEKTFMPFSEFYKKNITKQVKKVEQTKEDIVAKAEELRLAHQGKHGGVKNNGVI